MCDHLVPPVVAEYFATFIQNFQRYDKNFTGPISPEESVGLMRKVIEGATLEKSGQFLSHFGNRNWLTKNGGS